MVDASGKKNLEAGRVLEICRDIESVNAQLYDYFAEIFSEDQEISELWRKTAREEENHARQFVLALKMRREQMVDTLYVDGSTAENTLSLVRAIYEEVRISRPTLIDALKSAITLEANLGKFHMTTVGHFVEESHKKLFSAMMKADKRHVEALKECYQRLLAA